jgi:hypothetical protein
MGGSDLKKLRKSGLHIPASDIKGEKYSLPIYLTVSVLYHSTTYLHTTLPHTYIPYTLPSSHTHYPSHTLQRHKSGSHRAHDHRTPKTTLGPNYEGPSPTQGEKYSVPYTLYLIPYTLYLTISVIYHSTTYLHTLYLTLSHYLTHTLTPSHSHSH